MIEVRRLMRKRLLSQHPFRTRGTERSNAPRSLLEKKKLLQLSLQEVSREIPSPPKPLELPNMPKLPAANFSKEEAAIKKAKLSLSEQATIVTKQKELIFSLQESGIDEDAIIHEQAKLAITELNHLQSKVNLDSTVAALNSAKADRKYEEYKHNLEQQKRLLDLQRQPLNYQQANSRYVVNPSHNFFKER